MHIIRVRNNDPKISRVSNKLFPRREIRVRRDFYFESYRTVRREMCSLSVNSIVNPFRPKSYVYARWDIKSYRGFHLRAFERTPEEKR